MSLRLPPLQFVPVRVQQDLAAYAARAELARIGIHVPIVLTETGRTAFAENPPLIRIGRGFEPGEIAPVARHEAGHLVRKDVHLQRQLFGDAGIFANEQEADAIGGALTIHAGRPIEEYLAVLRRLPVDPSHGSYEQRASAAIAGAKAALAFFGRA